MLCDGCKKIKYGVMIYTCKDKNCDGYNVAGANYVSTEPRYGIWYLSACDLKKELEKNSLPNKND